MSESIKEVWEWVSYRGVTYTNLYKISNLGKILSYKTGKEKEIAKPKGKRRNVSLSTNGGVVFAPVARLVASTFQRELKKGEIADHKNNNPTDDRESNIQIITQSQNVAKDFPKTTKRDRNIIKYTYKDGITRFKPYVYITRIIGIRTHNMFFGAYDDVEQAIYIRDLVELELKNFDGKDSRALISSMDKIVDEYRAKLNLKPLIRYRSIFK